MICTQFTVVEGSVQQWLRESSRLETTGLSDVEEGTIGLTHNSERTVGDEDEGDSLSSSYLFLLRRRVGVDPSSR